MQSDSPPTRLLDGSTARSPSVELEGVDETPIQTSVSVVHASRLVPGSRAATCLDRNDGRDTTGPVVTRVGVTGESVTLQTSSGLALRACDGIDDRRGEHHRWCGSAFGLLERGRLRDPRLDLAGCVSAMGKPVAFAWVEPGRRTSYVVVGHDDYSEAYRVIGGLPVRVTTTTGIDLERSSASFEISEHDRSGELLSSYTLETRVAG